MSETNIITSGKTYEIPDISVGELFSQIISKCDDNSICLIDANIDTKLTFKELITKSNALAMALIERGINKSDTILTFAENSIELAIVIMASVFLGTTLYPISPIANVYELEKLFETLDSLVVFTSQSKSNAMKTILNNHKSKAAVKSVFMVNGVFGNYITFDELLKEGHNKCLPQIPYFAVKDPRNETFVILQSSGTTGVPKSLLISNYSVVAYLHAMKSDIESDFHKNNIDGQPVFGHITPFGCVSGISSLLGYIFCGFSVVIFREYSEELILKSIEKYHVHILFITPAFGSALILGPFAGKYDLSSLRVIVSSGAAFTESVGKAIVNKYDVLLQEIYGMTEGGIITQMPYFNNGDEYMAGNLGQPNNNVEIKIRDTDSGESLGPGLGGEICVRGPMLFKGYLNNPLATSEAIDSEGWLRTGDIGHYDQQKRLFITDRLKELIKYETIAVSPTEIELFLLTHKCVAEVAVVGVKHETQSQWVRAYVKVKDGMSVTEEELKQYVADNLNEAKQLRAGVVFVDHIPRTTIRKVDRRYFKQLIANELIKSQ